MGTQLFSLPNELLQLIADNLDPKDINALIRTSRRLMNFLTPLLHKLALEDKDDTSALHWASMHGHLPLVALVLENGGKVNSRDRLGKTALHRAAEGGDEEVTRLLLKEGANATAQDHLDDMPIHSAAQRQQKVIVKIFLENGVKPDALGNKRNTALHQAIQWSGGFWIQEYHGQELGMIRLLLDYGASPDARNEFGRTPSFYAENPDVLELLKEGNIGMSELENLGGR